MLQKIKKNGTELGIPPEGGYTGDTSGPAHFIDVLAPWTCESCPDPWSQFKALGPEFMGTVVTSSDGIRWGDIYTPATFIHEIPIHTWPTRCRECDTRYKKHKRTTNALVRIFRHPLRQEKVDGVWWLLNDRTYEKIKLITLTVPNTIFDIGPVVSGPQNDQSTLVDGRYRTSAPGGAGDGHGFAQRANSVLAEQLKEPFRRLRKKKFWKEHVVYGRWFAEVTWKVHYADGPSWPQNNRGKGSQWMPTSKELEGAVSVEIHPHLHVIAVAKFMDKEKLTEWWDHGTTHVQATGSWWSCKQYLTKYLNKQQLEGRHQGTFGKTT